MGYEWVTSGLKVRKQQEIQNLEHARFLLSIFKKKNYINYFYFFKIYISMYFQANKTEDSYAKTAFEIKPNLHVLFNIRGF